MISSMCAPTMRVKAALALTWGEVADDTSRVLQQVVRFADRCAAPAVSHSPDPRALESYRTWLSNEFRSLTAELYPTQPEMLGAIAVNNAGDKFHFRGEPPASTRAERMLTILGLDWSKDSDAGFGAQQVAA